MKWKEGEGMIVEGFMVPHPPVAVPEVGHAETNKCKTTIAGYQKVAERIAEIAPDLMILSSPHAVLYRDWFNVSGGERAYGDLHRFGANVEMEVSYDTEFIDALKKVKDPDFPCGTEYDRDVFLDHGTIVPLYYINQKYTNYKLVRISLSGFSLAMHYELGMYLEKAAELLGRKAAYVASGDLSHCMPGSSYGCHPEGSVYDERIMKTMSSGSFGELLAYDPAFLDAAMECGHRSFTIMAGAFDGYDVSCQQWSHEAPFGIGYGVVHVKREGVDEHRHFLNQYLQDQQAKVENEKAKEDGFVSLARKTIETYVRDGKVLKVNDVPMAMQGRAGVFVSLHKDGMLRGCIGTILPVRDNIALEIVHNAIEACSRDPRFTPVEEDELPYLSISVDVLSKPESCEMRDLDVKKYGVICSTRDGRRGLLLPDLDGVDSVKQQVQIACKKGGIDPDSDHVLLQRFTVTRHV